MWAQEEGGRSRGHYGLHSHIEDHTVSAEQCITGCRGKDSSKVFHGVV